MTIFVLSHLYLRIVRQPGQDLGGQVYHSVDVDRHDLASHCHRVVFFACNSCVVDENVDAQVLGLQLAYERLDACHLRHIKLKCVDDGFRIFLEDSGFCIFERFLITGG